jgi:hypothetical protein
MLNRTISSVALVLAAAGSTLAQPAAPGVSPAPVQSAPAVLPPGAAPAPVTPDACNPLPGACGPAGVSPADGMFAQPDGGPRVWGSAEYLLWRLSGYDVPPLVTTGPARFPVGFLGSPGTQVLFGGSSLGDEWYSGLRLTGGVWLGDCRRIGVEGDFFFLAEQNAGASFSLPVLARPFTNANTGGPFSEFAGFPGIATGRVAIDAPTELWGAGLRLRRPLCCGCWGRVDLLGGFQFLSLEESLTVSESATFLPGGPFPGLSGRTFQVTDRFATENRFYGGQAGVDARFFRGNWLINLRALVALGTTYQEVDIQGSQVVTDAAGRVTTFPGGLLALPGANIGRVEDDEFTVVPQVGVNLGYRITERITLFGGYSFLYWSSVVRPGDQIDPVLDVNRIPNFVTDPTPVIPPRPANPFKRSDLWVHGLNFGVALNW